MIIAGAILIALGIGATIYGFYLNNSMEAQLNALFSSGNVDPGTGWIVVGIIALVIGIVLLVVGMTKKSPSKPLGEVAHSTPVKHEKTCPHCGSKLDGSPAVCPFCGKSTTEKKPTKDNICPFCESILPAGVAFCPACGKRISAEPELVSPTPPPTPAPKKTVEPVSSGGWGTPTDSDL